MRESPKSISIHIADGLKTETGYAFEKRAAGSIGFEAKNLSVEIDQKHEYRFVLPQTGAYKNVGFEKEFQYKKQ